MDQGRVAVAIAVSVAIVAGCAKPPVRQFAEPVAVPMEAVTPKTHTLDEARQLLRSGQKEDYERALLFLARSADETTKRRALALHGLFLFDEKRYDDAVPALTQAAAAYAEVAP